MPHPRSLSPALSSQETRFSPQTHSKMLDEPLPLPLPLPPGLPSRNNSPYANGAFINSYDHSGFYPPLGNELSASFGQQSRNEDFFTSAPDQVNSHGSSSTAFTPEPSPQPETTTARSMMSTRRRNTPTRPRVVRDARGRKQVKKPPGKDNTVTLTKPLSELARDFPDVPIHDVEAFAARSTASRQGLASRDGRVKRPLNAFMLYRKAYQEIAMTQVKNENPDNQAVSKVCGQSWSNLEAEDVRRKFRELASTETRKHKEAHPDYRYIPRKNIEAETDPLDPYDDSDGEYRGRRSGSRCRGRSRAISDSRSRLATPRLDPAQVPAGNVAPIGQNYRASSPYWGLPAQQAVPMIQAQSQYGQQQQPQMSIQPGQGRFATSLQHDQSIQMQQQQQQHQHEAPVNTCSFMNTNMSVFVDPKLFPSHQNPGAENDGIMYGGQAKPEGFDPQGLFWGQFGGNDMGHGCVLPFDSSEAHDAYLRGTVPDWHVESLDFPEQNDPFLQSEEYFKRAFEEGL